MRKFFVLTAIFTALLTALSSGQPAQAALAAQAEVPSSPLCMPGFDGLEAAGCQELGPTAYLNRLESEGLILPREPLPAHRVDPAFGELPFNYVRLRDEDTPIFSSLENAMQNESPYRTIPAGFNFVSYVDYYQGSGGARQYMIEPGMWIRGGSTNGQVAPSQFSGLIFSGTPTQKFGWTIYETPVQAAPGEAGASRVIRSLPKFTVIQVYQSMEAEGTTWLLIGPDEWIDAATSALVYPATEPPAGVTDGRWIEVNLKEQTLSVYQDNRLILATLTSTGIAGWWTRPGLFQITEKLESTPMSGAFEADRSDYYYLEDVPWTMYFDEARALHGAYWHNYFGYEQSHGCVNLSPADSHWLYLWANVGDFVYVWDPSGATPTDPALYTAGGA